MSDLPEQLTMAVPIPAARPKLGDRWVRLAAAKAFAQDLVGEFPDLLTEGDEEESLQSVADDLFEELGSSGDGYEIAKNLERNHGWSPDARMVEILDGASSYQWEAYERGVKEWVAATGVKPKLEVGATVSVLLLDQAVVTGEVVGITLEVATYTLFIEALGHVRSGHGTHGIIKHFEDVEGTGPVKVHERSAK